MRGDLFHHIGHRIGQGGMGGGDAQTFGRELAGFHVHRSAFDASSADVDAEQCHGLKGLKTH